MAFSRIGVFSAQSRTEAKPVTALSSGLKSGIRSMWGIGVMVTGRRHVSITPLPHQCNPILSCLELKTGLCEEKLASNGAT
jgi:hypothetical protein